MEKEVRQPRSIRSAQPTRRKMAVLALLALLVPATGWAQIPAREGNTWDWRHHQPTRAGVQRRERAAGVAPSSSRQKALDGQVKQLDRQLLGHRPNGAARSPGPRERPLEGPQ